MFRPLTWMSTMALALVLGWQGAAAQGQLFSRDGKPADLLGDSSYNDSDDQAPPAPDDAGDMPSDDETADDNSSGNDPAGDEYRTDGSRERNHAHDPGDDDGQTKVEVIKERFPSGRVRIEREVTQDAQGNYVNHGKWKMWDDHGNGVSEGVFEHGKRVGTWVQWYRGVQSAKLFAQQPYQQFPAPFASQATFKDGQLDGTWTIYDGKQHKISQWQFTDGRRNGTCIWWHPSGRKMREIQYRDGDIDGTWLEWDAQGNPTVKDTYEMGRKLAMKTAYHTANIKKSQGMYLFAREIEQTPDDWFNCKPQTTTHQGKDEKHGQWTSWYANGQRQLEGAYKHDAQDGKFTWWHANGQKALEGSFDLGKQDGTWTWWYPSGQKSIEGHYATGNPTGRWTWWKEDGKVTQSADLSHTEGVVIETPAVPDTAKQTPTAKMPKPRTKTR